MSSFLADLSRVVALACRDSRDPGSQRSLLRVAVAVDEAINANTETNTTMWGEHAGSDRAVQQRPFSNLTSFAIDSYSGGPMRVPAEVVQYRQRQAGRELLAERNQRRGA